MLDCSGLFRPDLPPAAVGWNGFARHNFTDGHIDAGNVQRELGLTRAHRPAWALALLSLALLAVTPGDARAFCSKSADGSKCHPQIVRESLDFLRPAILDTIADHVNDPDLWDKPRLFVDQWRRTNYATGDHFDNCNFDGGTERINERYLRSGQDVPGIVEALSPLRRPRKIDAARLSRSVDEDYPGIFEAAKQWAWVLHAVQDLYSHSNWVELGYADPSRDLVDRRLGAWATIPSDWRVVRGDVIAAQRPLPSSWKMEYPPLADPPRPAAGAVQANTAGLLRDVEAPARQPKARNGVPHVTDAKGHSHRLLISGHGPIPNPWNTCPLAQSILHDDLNKDTRTRGGNPEALTMAIGQTQHEWCRLLNLAHSRNTPAGAAVLMGLMVNPGVSPHPIATVCAPASAGEIEVVARVTRIQIEDDLKRNNAHRVNLVFAGFTTDFRRSARAQSPGIAIAGGADVPSDLNPGPLRFCLNADEQLVVTVQGWRDDGDSQAGDLNEGDTLLAGATGSIPSAAQLASRSKPFVLSRPSDNAHRQDLEVSFEVSAKGSASCHKTSDHRVQEPEYAH